MSQKFYFEGKTDSCKQENNTSREENREEKKTNQAAQGKAEKQVKSAFNGGGMNPEARKLAIVTMKETIGKEVEDTQQTQRMNMH